MEKLFKFRTIELPRDGDICVRFWRDTYACSFEDPDRYRRADTEYLISLAAQIREFPQCCVHLQRGDEILGQLVMHPRPGAAGYVNLFYLVPEFRGSGAGDALHEYVVRVFANLGVEKLQLHVSPTNTRALRYYRKHGWNDLGPQPGDEKVHLMELSLLRGKR